MSVDHSGSKNKGKGRAVLRLVPFVARPAAGRALSEAEQEHMRALAWRFRQSRSCHWGGVDRASPLVDYCTGLLAAGVDQRTLLTEFLCAIRCCGDCK